MALMALYAEDVRVFDAWGAWSYEGTGSWQKMIEEWFSFVGTEKIMVAFDDLKVITAESVAVISAIVTYSGISDEGIEHRRIQNRITWTLRLNGKSWKIFHEHTSVPVDFNDSKAILERI